MWPGKFRRAESQDAFKISFTRQSFAFARLRLPVFMCAATSAWRNIGLWRGEPEQGVLNAINSLPLHAWMAVKIRPLGTRPNDLGVGSA